MSPAERLFLPVLLVLKLFGYVRFFLGMLPGAAAAIRLGVFAAWVCPRARRRLRARGGIRIALLLWEPIPLAGAVLLGGWNGWLLTYAAKGRVLGRCLGGLGYLLGRLLAARANRIGRDF